MKCVFSAIEHECVRKEMQKHYVRSPVSWPLVPTEELRFMIRRSTSFLSKTLEAGPSSEIALTPSDYFTQFFKCAWEQTLNMTICLGR